MRRRRLNSRFGVAGALALSGILAAGCSHSAKKSSSQQGASHRGGTFIYLTTDNPGTVDPAIDYGPAWTELNATNDGLVAFRKVGGGPGNVLVPNLAETIPKPTNGGRTYTFQLRKDIRYSNGAALKASDFRHVFERMFKVLGPTSASFYSVLVGGPACAAKPKTCSLPGGVVGDDAQGIVTFHLTRPDGEFLNKLALPFAFAVPPAAPNKDIGTHPLPGTGPYKWAEYTPNRQIKLVRNPYFKEWSHDAQPDGYPDVLLRKIGLPIEAEITQVENNQADTIQTPTFPADRLGEISTRYAAQVHVNLQTAINYLALNTRVAPFDNVLARRALNYATDRAALVKIYGGPKLAEPSCQVLPQHFPGYKPYCPYSSGGGGSTWTAPDVAKAKRLVASSGTRGQKVTIVMPTFPIGRSVGLYFTGLLKQLGYKASLKLLSPPVAGPFVADSRHHVQASLGFWSQDYPAASDFLNTLTGCRGFIPNSEANANVAEFCNRPIQGQMDRALSQGVTDPAGANELWAKIDHEVTDQSPLIVMNNPKAIDFVSKRVGNYMYNPLWYFLIDQAWVK